MKLLTYKAPVALLSYIPSARTIILMHMLLEREIATRCTLTHTTRLHRKQGVWAPVHAVCSVQPGRKTPILTKYNQDRTYSHRSI